MRVSSSRYGKCFVGGLSVTHRSTRLINQSIYLSVYFIPTLIDPVAAHIVHIHRSFCSFNPSSKTSGMNFILVRPFQVASLTWSIPLLLPQRHSNARNHIAELSWFHRGDETLIPLHLVEAGSNRDPVAHRHHGQKGEKGRQEEEGWRGFGQSRFGEGEEFVSDANTISYRAVREVRGPQQGPVCSLTHWLGMAFIAHVL